MRMNFFYCWVEAGPSYDALCEFFVSAKPGDSLLLEQDHICVGMPDGPYKPTSPYGCYLGFILRMAEGYLVRLYDGDDDWKIIPEADVNEEVHPGVILVAESKAIKREDVFRELVSKMPVQDAYNSFWCLYDELDLVLPTLYRLLIHRDGTLDFWRDFGIMSGQYIRAWSKGGEFTIILENVEFIGWYKGQLYALDYEEGLFALGVYDRSFLP